MQPNIKTAGLIGKYAGTNLGPQLRTLSDFLLAKTVNVIIDQTTADTTSMESHGVEIMPRQEMAQHCDLIIVMGGDGTLLNAARSLASEDVPLVGINMGRLGFLTDITFDSMTEKLSQILEGNYILEERLLLQALITRNGAKISESIAFNDIVVHKWEEARMLEFSTIIDGAFVNVQRSDGLILSTPTGSTAYALSGGGPIMHPTLNSIVLVSICPHTLSQRPLVVSGDSVIEITISKEGHGSAQVTCDGQINLDVIAGDLIKIQRYKQKVKFMHPREYNYFEILRTKLHWGERL